MSDKLTLTDLKEHCIKTLRMKDAMRIHGVKFKSDNVEQEHRMVLDLILEHEQMEEHDKKVREDTIDEFKNAILSQFCACCDQEACEGGCAGSIQQCYVAANLAEVANDTAEELKEEKDDKL